MALSARNRKKHIEEAMKRLPADGARPVAYATGGAGTMPPVLYALVVVGGWVAVSLALLLGTGILVGPGLLPALAAFAIYQSVARPRSVLLTDRTVTAFTRTFWNNQANDPVANAWPDALRRPIDTSAGYTRIQIGTEFVWIQDKQLRALLDVQGVPTSF